MFKTDKILLILVAILGIVALFLFISQKYNQAHQKIMTDHYFDSTTRKDYNDEPLVSDVGQNTIVTSGLPFTAYIGKTYSIKDTNDQFMLTGFLYTGPECPVGAIYGQYSNMPPCVSGKQGVYYKIVSRGRVYEESMYRSDSTIMNQETPYIGAFLTNNNTDYKKFALMTVETEDSLRMH